MNRRGDIGRDQRGHVRSLTAIFDSADADNTCQLHLHLNSTVEIQVPKETIFIIAYSVHRAHNQTARSAYLCGLGQPVMMFPQNSIVFFMHADGIFDGAGGTVPIHNIVVKVINLAEAVAP